MPLQQLLDTPCLKVSYETTRQVLLLEWRVPLTLAGVQVACAQVARLVLVRRYPQVLICTQQVQSVGDDITNWLAPNVLPGLCLLGASRVGWVHQASPEGDALAQRFRAGLPLASELFTDYALALAWLESQPYQPVTPSNSASETSRLRRVISVLNWRVLTMLARHPGWLN